MLASFGPPSTCSKAATGPPRDGGGRTCPLAALVELAAITSAAARMSHRITHSVPPAYARLWRAVRYRHERRFLVRPDVPVGLDHVTLGARGGPHARPRRALACHEPGGAQRGARPTGRLPSAADGGLGPGAGADRRPAALRRRRGAAAVHGPRPALPSPTRANRALHRRISAAGV